MAEYFLGQQQVREMIQQQLASYRQTPEHFVKQSHPLVSFITLERLIHEPEYGSFIHQPLLRFALKRLPGYLTILPGCHCFDPERVWVGIAAPVDAGWFGGFHHTNQGYRYIQKISLTSLAGAFSLSLISETLRTLELLRAYVHDTLHAATYRLFCPAPPDTAGDLSFYRLQYGMNFRRSNGQSYSSRDSVRSATTHNLGTIMEAATDRFAQEFVLQVAQHIGYQPATSALIEEYLYRECTGQLTDQDILLFRSIEHRQAEAGFLPEFSTYLRQMRLFAQYVTMRYQYFLKECGAAHDGKLHDLILRAMISGKLGELQDFLNAHRGEARSFMALFKTSEY